MVASNGVESSFLELTTTPRFLFPWGSYFMFTRDQIFCGCGEKRYHSLRSIPLGGMQFGSQREPSTPSKYVRRDGWLLVGVARTFAGPKKDEKRYVLGNVYVYYYGSVV